MKSANGIDDQWLSDTIHLDKHGDDDHFPDTWDYYRITGLEGLGNVEGTEGATIEVCRLTWPDFQDKGTAVQTPGVVGLEAAWGHINRILNGWGIDRERSVFIGVRDRKKHGDTVKLKEKF